jgi:hypothetical protein
MNLMSNIINMFGVFVYIAIIGALISWIKHIIEDKRNNGHF